MTPNEPLSSIGQAVPELPGADVERAQQSDRDTLGFEIGWLYPGKEIGSVSRARRSSSFAGESTLSRRYV